MTFCLKPVISLWVLWENHALQLANQSECYTDYKDNPYNNRTETFNVSDQGC